MNIKTGRIKILYRKAFLVHVFCWLLFISYELGLVYYSAGRLESPFIYLYYYFINILFFYLFIKTLNFSFRDGKAARLKGFLILFILTSAHLVIKFLSDYIMYSSRLTLLDQLKHSKEFLVSTLFRTGYYATLATFYWVADHLALYRRQSLEAEKQQLLILQEKSAIEIRLSETRNAYLQQQINPHMLLNSLNFIYNTVYKQSREAAHSVVLLSDIMRFSLEGGGKDGKTSLKDEVRQINNLIEINRQRYDHFLYLETDIRGNMGELRIIPLILFTLTENIFKHGNLKSEKHPALLSLSVDDQNELHYYSRNLKKVKSGFPRNSSIGIQNVRTRMEFAYPDRYELNLSDSGNFFETSLKIIL